MNFQNIPRQDKVVKKAIRPKLDALAFFDYEQIEYRLLAYYLHEQLGEGRMVNNFKAGLDPHTALAQLLMSELEIDYTEPITDAQRQTYGKTPNFAIIYAGGKPTIKRQLARAGIPCDDALAKRILAAVRNTMPEVTALQEEIQSIAKDRGYIKTLWGRHLHPDPKIPYRDALRKLLNALIQGCAADLMRNAMREVHAKLKVEDMVSHLVLTVHDEIAIDAPEDELERLSVLVPTCMGFEQLESVVPITTEMSVTFETWADKEEYVRR